MKLQYRIIRSGRRSTCIELKNGEIIVRAPFLKPDKEIDRFVESKRSVIEKKLGEQQKAKENLGGERVLSPEELRRLAEQAHDYIPQRVAHYAPLVGVKYGRITIRAQHTRWGSCSSAGNLNFNCLLMLAPSDVIDSVVVHELCHLLEMNHSKSFYSNVLRVFPDYNRCREWLKKYGNALMARLPE